MRWCRHACHPLATRHLEIPDGKLYQLFTRDSSITLSNKEGKRDLVRQQGKSHIRVDLVIATAPGSISRFG